ncbi:MAG: peptide chain release factor N(5)-glutamine methyltransferase [Bacillota bacterium]|nr:peptide chain release factor N(5)-glutamine methyltransferase [Bacillota bacterium]
MISIKQALIEASSFLRENGLSSPRDEAELLLAFLLKKGRLYLYAHGENELPLNLREEYRKMLFRRSEGEPFAYLTGKKEFMGLSFLVEEGVLVPRPETEHLVETALEWISLLFPQSRDGKTLRILDLGTGCGNLAVSLAYHLPNAFLAGVDISAKALQLALINARRMDVEERVAYYCGDFWNALPEDDYRFDVVVSNPPYIPRLEIPLLSSEVQKEPRQALDGGVDGLDAYREIFRGIKKHLRSPGFLGLEVGEGQAQNIVAMGCRLGFVNKVEIVRDYAGIERIVMFQI